MPTVQKSLRMPEKVIKEIEELAKSLEKILQQWLMNSLRRP